MSDRTLNLSKQQFKFVTELTEDLHDRVGRLVEHAEAAAETARMCAGACDALPWEDCDCVGTSEYKLWATRATKLAVADDVALLNVLHASSDVAWTAVDQLRTTSDGKVRFLP